jgi:hypothetical protein
MAAKRFPYRVLGEPDAVISGNPYWLLPTVLGLAEDGTREYLPGRLKEYKAACAYHDPGGCCPDSGGRARADQAPRAQAVCRAQADALPEARTFRPGQDSAEDVAAFAAELLNAGFSMTVRPMR